jgi:AAHS family 4-hydroxybenzoate transporter-like MFS transporter
MTQSWPADTAQSGETVEPADSIIDRRFSAYQIFVFILCAMVVFLDGIDSQIIGIGAPLISLELGIERGLFGWIISAGTFGATLGAFSCGVLADRLGRKWVLICATLCFGLATCATAFVHDYASLLLLRFVTGIGLGGAVPCFVSLTSEYAPSRHRAAVVSLLWAAFPLGAALGALLNSYLVGRLGWRPLFIVWGIVPILVALLHSFTLPESVRFLLRKGGREARVLSILKRIQPDAVRPGIRYVAVEASTQRNSPAELFSTGLRPTTWSLSTMAFIVFGLLTVAATWTPTLLTPHGYTPATAALIVAFNGFGSFIGTIGAGFLLERIGIARSVVPALLIATLSFVALGLATSSFDLAALASFCAGMTLGLVSSSILAFAALTYPTAIRSTGIGFAMGAGRFGAVVMPLLVGQLVQQSWDIGPVMRALACLAALAIPCVLVLAHSRPRNLQDPTGAGLVASPK